MGEREMSLPSSAKIWKIARNVVLVLIALGGIFFLIVVPALLAHLLTRGRFQYPDPNDGRTPQFLGLDFRWIEFRASDGVLLRGWYVPAGHRARGTVIFCHGLNRTRVEMLPQALFAEGLHLNGLLFDFRHHGQSEGDTTTLGYRERLDVLAAVRFAREVEQAPPPVILWGISMGAAAALVAAAESRDVAAVISDSSFLSFRDTIEHHLRLFLRLPAFPVGDEIIYWSAWKGKFRPGDFDLQRAVERIGPRPILFVAVEGDRRMPPVIARKLYEHARSPASRLLLLPGNRHGDGFHSAPNPYKQAVQEFVSLVASPAP
jgi:pimeloyl-ACP methyl ester carboxylesterase